MTDNQLNVLYCPKCNHSNPLNATRCGECGLVFPATIPVDDLVPDQQQVTSLEKTSAKAKLEKAGTIVFSIAGYDRPLFIRRQAEIVLGRSAPGEPHPTIDLNPYRGQKMGVSRRHAVIRLSDEKALIEDLNSVNGTWHNENQLKPHQPHPLRNGDYLRLGHLVIVVHASAIDTLVLINTRKDAEKRLTTHVLIEHVGPCLSALTDLQTTINTLTDQKTMPIAVHSMNAGAKGAIHIRLSGATQSLDVLREQIMPWRRRHSVLLNDTKLLDNKDNKDSATTLPPSKVVSVQSRYHNAYRMLFQAVLDRIASGKSEETIAPHRATLTNALNILASNPLEISDATVSGDVVEPDPTEDTGTKTLFKNMTAEE